MTIFKMNHFRKYGKITALVIIFIIISMLAQSSVYAETEGIQHWNIMFVIDGSARFQNDDKQDIRLEAVDSFLDTMWNSGDYAGAIVTQVRVIDNLDQYNNAIVLDTWKNGAVKLDNNRNNLKAQIRKAPTINFIHNQDTDIGSALLLAARRLEEANEVNGLPGVIILLTNNVTNFNNQIAERNKAEAISLILEQEIKLGAVYYNNSGNQHTEIRELVTAANGMSAGDLSIAEYYSEVYDLADIAPAFDTMLRMVGINVPATEDYFTSSGENSFSIPGTGIEELNLRFRTVDGSSLRSGFKVDIIRPNGESLSEGEMKSIYSQGKTYINYKITTNLIGGEWKVRVTVPENSAAIRFDRIFNTSIETGISISPDPSTLHTNMITQISAYLLKNGVKVTDSQAYVGYKCKLVLTNAEDGTVKEIELEQNKNGEYVIDLPLDFYGKYYVKAVFSCNEFYSESKPVVLDLTNRTPVCQDPAVFEIPCSIFENNEYMIDCARYVTDAEDKKLEFALGETTLLPDAVRLEDSVLYIDPYRAGSGDNTVYIRAIDSQGAFSTIAIPVDIVVADIKAVMETNPGSESLHVNLDNGVSVSGYMTDNGEKIDEAFKYKDYTCYLVLRDAETGEVFKTVELSPDGNGMRNVKLPLDFYGDYDAYIEFLGEFPIASKSQHWDLTNREPHCAVVEGEQPIYVRYIHPNATYSIEGLISDDEDPTENLKVELLSEVPPDSVELAKDNKTITVSLDKLPKAEIYLKVTDTQGASSNLKISYEAKDYTTLAIIVIAVVLILIIVLIFVIIRKKNSIYPKGKCSLEFDFVTDDDEEKTIVFELTPPGNGSKRNTNLYEMVSTDMRRHDGGLRQACDELNIEYREVEKFIEELAKDLKKIEVSCVIKNQKGYGRIGKVKVSSGKDSSILFNSSKKFLPGGHSFTISYNWRNSDSSDEYRTSNSTSYRNDYSDDSYDSY